LISPVEPEVVEPAVEEAVDLKIEDEALDFTEVSEEDESIPIDDAAPVEDEALDFTKVSEEDESIPIDDAAPEVEDESEDETLAFDEPAIEAVVAPVEEDVARQPKLLVAGQPLPQEGSEEEIIIDLTQDLGLSDQREEEVEEVLNEEPQIISFKTIQTPNVFAAPQKSNEVISFVLVEPAQPAVPVLEESSSPASPVSPVTPLLPEEDLRALLQQGEEQLDQLVPQALVDAEDAEDAEDGFALIDSDYSDEDNLIADLEVDAIIEDITATENILENIVTSTPSSSAQTTKTDVAVKELKAVPPTIAADPVFKEIVSEDKEQLKRGFGNYAARHNRIYAHKYSDNYSNWYYFRRGY